jgi:hypothetical protein
MYLKSKWLENTYLFNDLNKDLIISFLTVLELIVKSDEL